MFDRYVAQQRPSWKRRALIIASLALHAIAAVVILIWSFFHVEEIAPPAVSLTFFNAPPPPPPPPPPPKKKSSSSTVEKKPETIIPTKVVQPTDVPKIVQPKEPEKKQDEKDDDDGVEGGEEGGVKGGTVGGVKGGVLGGSVGGTGTDVNAKPGPGKMVAAFTLIKEQLQHPDPRMPEMFRTKFAGQTLRGMYKVCLRQDGRVSDVHVMTSLPGADDEVVNQIKAGWVYKPQPVPVCFVAAIQVTVR